VRDILHSKVTGLRQKFPKSDDLFADLFWMAVVLDGCSGRNSDHLDIARGDRSPLARKLNVPLQECTTPRLIGVAEFSYEMLRGGAVLRDIS
jgi:hypothetical protein